MKSYFVIILLSSIFVFAGSSKSIEIPIRNISYICGCKPDIVNPAGSKTVIYQGNYCGFQEIFLIDVDFDAILKIKNIKKVELQLYCADIYGSTSEKLLYEPIVGKWDDGVTYNKRPGTDSDYTIETGIPKKSGWQIIDITKIINAIVKDKKVFHGIMGLTRLGKTKETSSIIFSSVESANPPKIIVYLR